MNRGAWQATVHGVTKSQTRLNNFSLTLHVQHMVTAHASLVLIY